jgi:hypothetical protein
MPTGPMFSYRLETRRPHANRLPHFDARGLFEPFFAEQPPDLFVMTACARRNSPRSDSLLPSAFCSPILLSLGSILTTNWSRDSVNLAGKR